MYSLGLECLGLEAVSRRFLERFGLVSVLRVQRLGLISVLKIYVSVFSSFVTCLVNIHAMYQDCGYQEENNGSDSRQAGCPATDFTS